MQIFQIIELEIMDNATMAERKLLAEQQRICQDDLELNYDKLRKTPEASDAYERITKTLQDLERRYTSLAQQLKENGGRHDSYLMRINNVLKDLKGTREQRVKNIETGKTSFVGLLKMLQDEDRRAAVGLELAMHQTAEAKELNRLTQLHTYMDGISDQPILTADTTAFPAPSPSTTVSP
jgi:chromosome segregation ATPase